MKIWICPECGREVGSSEHTIIFPCPACQVEMLINPRNHPNRITICEIKLGGFT